MREVGILEAKTKLSALIADVESGGEDVTVTRHGRPVVRIVKANTPPNRKTSGAELVRLMDEAHARIIAEIPAAGIADAESVLTALRNGDDEE